MSGYRGGSGRGGQRGDVPYRGGRSGGDGDSRGRGGYQGGGGGRQGGSSTGSSSMLEGAPCIVENVKNLENRAMAAFKGERAERGQQALRPSYGTKGRQISLRANYFNVQFKEGVKFYSYTVTFTPEPKSKRHRLALWEKILTEATIKKAGAASDKANELVTLLEFGDTPPIRQLRIHDERSDETHKYDVKFELHGEIDHQKVLTGLRDAKRRSMVDNELVVVRAMNILMAAHPGMDPGIVTLGKGGNNKFYWVDRRQQSMDLTGGLECIRGYYASVRLAAGQILLNLSVNHSAFYRPGPLMNLFDAFFASYGAERQLFHRYVKGLQVQCIHLEDETGNGRVRRMKTIWGLAEMDDGDLKNPPQPQVARFGATSDEVSFCRDGKWITVAEYFKQVYKKNVKRNVPVVNVGSKLNPAYMPMDLLMISPGRVFRGELNLAQRQAIIKFSCRRPPESYQSILDHGLDIIGVKGNHTTAVGIKIDPKMVAVPARILPPPNLKYGGARETPRFGSWNLVNKKFTNASSVQGWAAIVIRKSGPPLNEPMQYFRAFESKMKELGLDMRGLFHIVMDIQLDRDPKNQLAQIDSMFPKIKERNLGLAVICLPQKLERIFDHLKWRGDTIEGVVTHCCCIEKFMKTKNEQYFANNAMKVNLRLGGVNQVLDMPASCPLIAAGKTMVVGLDVTHPSPTDPDTFPSIASIVASTNASMGQWPGQVKIQERRMEKVEFLKEMMLARLHRWRKDNRALPQNIIIFRDGVSEGQYDMVLKDEVEQVKQACRAIYESGHPNLTVVVGGKRHHTRFFPTTTQDQDRTSNCPNGTVVDRGVTRPIFWEFFLQAQSPLQGSARSAHYVVIYDEIFTNPALSREVGSNPSDAIQELTHNICYMMGRCTRSISYSTPAFLADRFADRARKYVRAWYYERLIVRGEARPRDPPGDRVTTLAPRLSETMVYI